MQHVPLSRAGFLTAGERTLTPEPSLRPRSSPLGERLRALAPSTAKLTEGLQSASSSTAHPSGPVLASDNWSSQDAAASTGVAIHRKPIPREVEKMVNLLEQRVTQLSEGETARLRMLADHSQRLAEGLQAMRVAREIQAERRHKELNVIEGNLLMDIEKVGRGKKDLESKCEEVSEMYVSQLRKEIQKEESQRETVHDGYAREIGDEVRRLALLLEEQRTARLEYGERIVSSLEAEFQKVHGAIVAEQRQRFDAEGTMLRMVEDVCTRIRHEIQQERTQRQAVQGKLLGLLEETCSRIEASFSFTPSYGRGHGQVII